ncbi:short-chain dehydrogenase [Colletotrichum truncatum]|uniref:Short-chain dehydrogenase n=1 Tax=Colletotrichum truncatum TaxID=5467 RepID=A0ACC3ZCA5_COLTU|nr:short-chain dehydrogenase [Colletotrichum truncatum]KAF6782196.1 short-chain dehydrogenase [Colletotrichum truncatum]
MSKQIILITGANRGIGNGLVAVFLQQPDTTVIAAVRDPTHISSTQLLDLPASSTSRVIVIQLDSADESGASAAVEILQNKHSINSLDVVIANAGIKHSGKPVVDNLIDTVKEHFAVNTLGPLLLYQATAPLLKTSTSGCPKFIAISSNTGSIAGMDIMAGLSDTSPYGGSKAALNWFMRRIHFDEDWLTSFVLNPGFVMTDMVMETMKDYPVNPQDLGAITVEESAKGLMERVQSATRKDVGGTFLNFDGQKIPW